MRPRRVSERGGCKAAALVVFLAAVAAASCGRSRPPAPLEAVLVEADGSRPALIRVTGLSSDEARTLPSSATDAAWHRFMTVTVLGGENIAMAGRYRIADDVLEFEPQFPLDRGRDYVVRLYPSRLPEPRTDPATAQIIRRAPAAAVAPTTVTAVSPGSAVWPENLLRFYIRFSAPMSRAAVLDFVRLVDHEGTEVESAFLPLDVDLWDASRMRFTVFFDPGRVKRGIRPNLELGRALIAGRRYAIAVDARWTDAGGRPLAAPFRHEFVAGPAEERAIEPGGWTVEAPASGTRDALVVRFPWGLDRPLMERALGVALAGQAVHGTSTVADGDRAWQFVPAAAWRAATFDLVVLTVLEDPAGNRVGRPFEIEMFRAPAPEARERVTVPFAIR